MVSIYSLLHLLLITEWDSMIHHDVYSNTILPFYFKINYQANNVKQTFVTSKILCHIEIIWNLELGLHIDIGVINIIWKFNYILIAICFRLSKKNKLKPIVTSYFVEMKTVFRLLSKLVNNFNANHLTLNIDCYVNKHVLLKIYSYW